MLKNRVMIKILLLEVQVIFLKKMECQMAIHPLKVIKDRGVPHSFTHSNNWHLDTTLIL